jgi:hypothetical protein
MFMTLKFYQHGRISNIARQSTASAALSSGQPVRVGSKSGKVAAFSLIGSRARKSDFRRDCCCLLADCTEIGLWEIIPDKRPWLRGSIWSDSGFDADFP